MTFNEDLNISVGIETTFEEIFRCKNVKDVIKSLFEGNDTLHARFQYEHHNMSKLFDLIQDVTEDEEIYL